jgi:hypothetical protein
MASIKKMIPKHFDKRLDIKNKIKQLVYLYHDWIYQKSLNPPTLEHSKLSRVSPNVHFITFISRPIVKVTPDSENIPSIALLRTDFILSLICSLLAKGFASPVALELEELVSSTLT